MATLVTRTTNQPDGTTAKGSELTHAEVDANFINLNTDKLEANTNITVADATVTGNLTVQGTTTTLNTATLQVEDKNITLNYSTGDSSGSADGAGITIQDAVDSSTDATILWDATNDKFTFSHDVAATLSTAAQPNITSVGTLTGFTSTGIDDNATSTSVTVSSGGKVTIDPAGSTQGTHELSVREADSPRITIDDINGTDTSVNGALLLRADTTNKGVIGYTGQDDLYVENKTAGGSVILGTADIDRVVVNSGGTVSIQNGSGSGSNGNLTLTASSSGNEGGQINFNTVSSGTYSIDTYQDDMRFLNGTTAGNYVWYKNSNAAIGMTLAGDGDLTLAGAMTLTPTVQNGIEIDSSYTSSYIYFNGPVGNTWIGQNTSGDFAVWTAGSVEALTIDSNGDAALAGNMVMTNSGASEGTTHRYLNDYTSTGMYVGLRANTTGDGLIYHGDNKNIEFWTNGTLRGKLSNTGNFELTASQCQYVGGFGAKTTGGTLNWNDSTNARSGNGHSLMVGNATNGPGFSSYYHPFSFEYNSKDGTGNMTQFAIPYNDPANQGMWFRSRYSGTWTAWSPVSIGVATTLSGVAASGDIYVGVNAESYVRFQGSTGTKYARFYLESDEDVRFTEGGTITANGNVVAYSTAIASDAKLKDNVETLDGCLDKVCQMRGVSYTWNDQSSKEGVEDIGVIAQEMAEIYPEVVTEVEGLNGRDPHLTVDYARLTAVLINAVKELRAEVEDLKNGAAV